ncbi:MAG: hypothetical protein GY928_25170 [Colwellia sp.]|nr:hypothetical protein [Colwellia sp.]
MAKSYGLMSPMRTDKTFPLKSVGLCCLTEGVSSYHIADVSYNRVKTDAD